MTEGSAEDVKIFTGMTRLDKFRNEYIRHAAQVEQLEIKLGKQS